MKDKKIIFPYRNIVYVSFGTMISMLFHFTFDNYFSLELKSTFHLSDATIGIFYSFVATVGVLTIMICKKISDNLNTKAGKRFPIIVFGSVGCIMCLILLT